VLTDDDRPCQPGEVGRIVATALHNYAMPLFRYEVGDLALVGEPGQLSYPVIEKIFGRSRNLLLAPDGSRRWLSFGTRELVELAPIIQHQFVQVSTDQIVARLVVQRPLADYEELAVRRHLEARIPNGIEWTFSYMESIPRNAGGKFEDFICEVH
jgi:phenylacetate-CoA ligase